MAVSVAIKKLSCKIDLKKVLYSRILLTIIHKYSFADSDFRNYYVLETPESFKQASRCTILSLNISPINGM